jgi:hypothetical protein
MLYAERFRSLAGESIAKTNGTYGGDDMPVLFWPANTREFTVTTDLKNAARNTTSLLSLYQELGTDLP